MIDQPVNGSPGQAGGSPVMVVSNREPYEHSWRKGQLVWSRTDGGLASALDRALRRLGGVWVAWGSGEADRQAGALIPVPPDAPAYRLRRVWLEPEEVAGGYTGYANQVLWPLCHVTLDRIEYRRRYWDAYRRLNERFAQAVLEQLATQPAPVWVHDFHLALLPELIKHTAPRTPVSVFWHVPWPSPEVFRVLPERRELVMGLLHADNVVFQTPDYAHAFCACARAFTEVSISHEDGVLEWEGHLTRVTARGIGVDFDAFASRAQAPDTPARFAAIRRRLGLRPGMRFGLGVDRMDYTKGLLKRLWALDQFFTRYPDYRGRFSYVQIAVPTRTDMDCYQRYRKSLWQTALEINDRHGWIAQNGGRPTYEWQPIVFLEERVDFDTLVAYYRYADLALVSSVNDGMNLVAKEYVAAQVDESGVLLVSHLTGAAEALTDAVIINPYDAEGLADAIRHALEMPQEERRRRMRALRASVEAFDIHEWVDACLSDAGLSVLNREPVSSFDAVRRSDP
jgi:trehalose 6-phosphate synthase